MKKIIIIVILVLGLIFQNCKNNKTKPIGVLNENHENVIEQEVDSTEILIKSKIEEDISIIGDTIRTTKPTDEPNLNTVKEVIKSTNETIPTIEEEEEVSLIKISSKKEIVRIEEIEKAIVKEVEIKTEDELIIVKGNVIKNTTVPLSEESKIAIDKNNWKVPVKYQTLKNSTNPTIDLPIGKSLYAKHCKSCHGAEGYGDGTKAAEMKGNLGDFSTAEFQSQSDGALFFKTSFGRDDMPEFTKKLPDDEDRWLIVNYTRTLAE